MRHLCGLTILVAIVALSVATAKAEERQFSLLLTVDATQSWKSGGQWSRSTSQQRYDISTRLHSDGRLYTDNLLDPDMDKRMHIKSDYYIYQGLLQLKKENAGRLPSAKSVQPEISAESMLANPDCVLDDCGAANMSPERLAAMAALKDNTPQEIEQFMKSFDAPGGHWLYFTGYSGCPNKLLLKYHSHFSGERAFDREKKYPKPFEMDWAADTQGTNDEQQKLCERYVVTVNNASGVVYVENVFIPSPHGTYYRKIGSTEERRDADLPPPYEAMRWADDSLHKAQANGNRVVDLKLTTPLDGDASALGAFEGSAKVTLTWSLTPTSR